jgi:hypothetical protein
VALIYLTLEGDIDLSGIAPYLQTVIAKLSSREKLTKRWYSMRQRTR